MKKKLQVVVALFIFGSAWAQAPAIEWQQNYGGSYFDYANSIHQTKDGGYIIAGSTESNDGDITENHGLTDFWVLKINNLGIIEWQKTFGGSNIEYAAKVLQTSEGGYIIAGTSSSNDGDVSENYGSSDYWIVKISSLGDIEWQKTLGGSGLDSASWIKQTKDGGYIVGGRTESTDGGITNYHGDSDIWIVKLSALGIMQWKKTFGGSNYDDLSTIEQTTDGGYILAGSTDSNDGDVNGNHGSRDIWIVKLSNSGNIQWQKTLGGSSYDSANCVLQTKDSGYIIAGRTYSSDGDVTINYGGFDFWVIKLTNEGNIQWQKTFGSSNSEFVDSIVQTNDDGYVVAGRVSSECFQCPPPFQKVWLIKLSNDGNMQWQKTIEGADSAMPGNFQQTADGGFIIATSVISNYTWIFGYYPIDIDYHIIKLAPEALTTNTFSTDTFHIYPNPAKNSIQIHTDTKTINAASVFTLEGKHVLTVTNTNQIDISNLTPGIYLVKIKSEKFETVKKLVIE
jgi:hypothetical protein